MPSHSKSQQRLMGQALSFKLGNIKKDNINPKYRKKIIKLANSMSIEDLKHFAKTKHEGLPERVSENKILNFTDFLFYNY